ncbi:MAG: response regulator transcription factor [Candidatus Nanopelagicaceae bacterium]|jgi:DNA-binding NarL/FixJ family response regulator
MSVVQEGTLGIRVLVVDDHPIFRAGICERLKTVDDQITVVGEGNDGFQAYELAAKLRPQVILMDIAMPGMTGIEATRKISNDFPEIEIIILSVYDDDQYVNAALQAGASGYLLKTVEEGELRDAVIKVSNGGSALSATVARSVLSRISEQSHSGNGMSDRELQVLELAARGLTNKNIAKELFLSIRTVEAHMRNVFEKLGVSSRTEAVTHAVLHHLIRLTEKEK